MNAVKEFASAFVRAEKIALGVANIRGNGRWTRGGGIVPFTSCDGIEVDAESERIMAKFDASSCGDVDYHYVHFPIAYLFDPDWEAKEKEAQGRRLEEAKARKAKEDAEAAEKKKKDEEEAAKRKEEADRQKYEELKARFEGLDK